MAKHESLSNDINLVKEFEELKLKQKLLIESLAQKKKLGVEKNLTDFNAKLDFLVQIFKEANNTEEEEASLDDHFQKIIDRIDELDAKYEKTFTALEDKLIGVKNEVKSGLTAEEKTTKLNQELSTKDFSSSKGTVGADASKKVKDDGDMPPPPDFKVDKNKEDLDKKDEASKEIEEKPAKKKGFFK